MTDRQWPIPPTLRDRSRDTSFGRRCASPPAQAVVLRPQSGCALARLPAVSLPRRQASRNVEYFPRLPFAPVGRLGFPRRAEESIVTDLLHDIAPLTFMCGKDGKDRNALRECKAYSIRSRWRFSPDRQAAPAMIDLSENTVELDTGRCGRCVGRDHKQAPRVPAACPQGHHHHQGTRQFRDRLPGPQGAHRRRRVQESAQNRVFRRNCCCTFRATASASSSPGAGPSLDSTMADRHGSVAAVGRRMRCRSQHVQAFEQSPSKDPTR